MPRAQFKLLLPPCLHCPLLVYFTPDSTAVLGGWRVGGRYAPLLAAAADLISTHHTLCAIHVTQASGSMRWLRVWPVWPTLPGSWI